MARQLFVNLPVRNLDKTVEFFTALGFSFNPDFTDENATCMIVNDGAYVMLLVESYFKTFTSKSIAATADTAEAIMSFSLESREAVDEVIRTALTSGGTASEEARSSTSKKVPWLCRVAFVASSVALSAMSSISSARPHVLSASSTNRRTAGTLAGCATMRTRVSAT